MEFIACLDQAQPTEGLTQVNLNHLEKVFKDVVGDKKEIDLDAFKRIVQSKNMFFVERIFKIFDADNSGTVSLDEFMRVMWYFSRQRPEEKLRYLFEVYDLNDDGTIQFSELRNVISECMKENGLAFSDYEIDELTKMLFEDADTDKSGSITFNEFQDQLRRHPAFMENLTLSVERWLLPPRAIGTSQKCFARLRPRKLEWNHIKNNWTSVVFLLAYFFVNVGLFVAKAVKYKDSSAFIIVARGCGQCLNFNSSFILVLVLRQTLTWLRTHGFAVYLPIDQHLYYHKVTGCTILVFSVIHTIMHICNFSMMSKAQSIPLYKLLSSTEYDIGWVMGSACISGWILLVVLGIIMISAMPFVRRNGKFEVFYCLHQLYLVFWLCLIIHSSKFWTWFIGPAIIYFMETIIRIHRNFFSSKKAYVQQGVLLPSNVTHLVIKRPPKFDFKPGDYVYINIPTIAKFEWHPFTISSAPEMDDVIWLHIRGVGEWTNSLNRFFDRQNKEAILSDELAKDLETSTNVAASSNALISRADSLILHQQSSANVFAFSPSCSSHRDIRMKNYVGRSSSEASAFRNQVFDTFCIWSPACAATAARSISAESQIDIDIPGDGNSQGSLEAAFSPISNQQSLDVQQWNCRRRTSFASTSTSRAIRKKNTKDAQSIIAVQKKSVATVEPKPSDFLRPPSAGETHGLSKEKRRSIRVSVANHGLRRCQTVIVMPTVTEDDEDDGNIADVFTQPEIKTEEEVKDLEREVEIENVVVTPWPLKIFLDGPYGSPTRHIFQARHAVLIATGIGVTPFASILQSIMYQYRKSRHTCPKCNNKWTDPKLVSNVHLRKVDFFWLNRHQRSFEWFVTLLSELEIQQAQLHEEDRFLDIHMYITSALDRTDMKAVGLQMALDLLYQKEKRCLITGLKSRTQPGRPNWTKVFTNISEQNKGKVTVFFCGPPQLAKTLQTKCNEFGFRFRKEIF